MLLYFVLLFGFLAVTLENSEGALLSDYLKQDCDFDRDNLKYTCYGIIDRFPKKPYDEYELQCIECFLPTFSKETFSEKNNLKSLNLTNNNVMNITSKAFSNFAKLEYIQMQHNKISNIERNAFYGVKRLYQINLSHNELRGLKDGFMNQLESFSIILNNNYIKAIGENAFSGILNVINLYLSQNKISNLNVDFLKHLPVLEVLYLDENNLCHIPLGLFQYSRDLKILNLSGNKLKNFLPGTFSGLTGLLSLNISNNQLSHFDSKFLIPLTSLSNLDISKNNFYYIDYGFIATHAPTLRVLSINDNIWTCDLLNNMVVHLASKGIHIGQHTVGRYKVTNINGVACYDGVQKIKEFDAFLKIVESHTNNITSC